MPMINVLCGSCQKPIQTRDKHRGQTTYFCSKNCQHAARREGSEIPCHACGKLTYRKPSATTSHVFCSRPCANAAMSEIMKIASPRMAERWSWKGGVIIRDGYRFIKMPNHPNARSSGYIAEHRLVLSTKIGRPLRENELVHHINHDKLDNAPDNLVLVRRAAHSRAHRLERTLGQSGWATHTNGCLECATTERRHVGLGLCDRCYYRLNARKRAAGYIAPSRRK